MPDEGKCKSDNQCASGLFCFGKSGGVLCTELVLTFEKKVKRNQNDNCEGDLTCTCGVCRQDADHQVGDTESCKSDAQCVGALCFGKSGGVLCTGSCTDPREEGETCNQNDNCAGDLTCTCGICRKMQTIKFPTQDHAKATVSAPLVSLLWKIRGIACTGECTDPREEGETCNNDGNCVGSLECMCGICRSGSVPDEGTCRTDGQCASGLFAWENRGIGCTGQCTGEREEGETCNQDDNCVGNLECMCGICRSGSVPDEGLVELMASALQGSFALENRGVSRTGQCTGEREEGETCNIDDNCVSNLECQCGICGQDGDHQVPDTGSCKSDNQCASGLFCEGKSGGITCSGHCTPLKELGKIAIKTIIVSPNSARAEYAEIGRRGSAHWQ